MPMQTLTIATLKRPLELWQAEYVRDRVVAAVHGRARTYSACHSASGIFRVAIRSVCMDML